MSSGEDPCVVTQDEGSCHDPYQAKVLAVTAIFVIWVGSTLGVFLPIYGRRIFKSLQPGSNLFLIGKAFSAGIVLALAFAHVLNDAVDKLSNPCLTGTWTKYPWSFWLASMGVALSLALELSATQFHSWFSGQNSLLALAKGHHQPDHVHGGEQGVVPAGDSGSVNGLFSQHGAHSHLHEGAHSHSKAAELDGGVVVLVDGGVNGHSAPHGAHSHSLGGRATASEGRAVKSHSCRHGAHSHSHTEDVEGKGATYGTRRHKIIAEVLEIGIVVHSILVGVGLGTSSSKCTVTSLFIALLFHQFFEGVALGSCIVEASYSSLTTLLMGLVFGVTTPFGIALGLGIRSSYNDNSQVALAIEGSFNAVTAGILIYMATVDLIAHDFFSEKVLGNTKLLWACFVAVLLGMGVMDLLAYWA